MGKQPIAATELIIPPRRPDPRPRKSLCGAINETCKKGIYDPHAEGVLRAQVEGCTSPRCPLYAVRAESLKGSDPS